jgi:hypothetical protein
MLPGTKPYLQNHYWSTERAPPPNLISAAQNAAGQAIAADSKNTDYQQTLNAILAAKSKINPPT